MAELIDKKHLAGLVHKTSKPKKTETGITHVPVETSLKPEHVLDWKDNGSHVVIVTTDGQKHKVEKKSESAKG